MQVLPIDAASARSILSCPAAVGLVVDGVDSVGGVLADVEEDGLALQDLDGVPTFSCPPDSLLARAAAAGRRALLTVESGLASTPGTLTLGGRLASRGRDACACCAEARDVVVLVVDLVVLDASRRPVHLAVEDFGAPEHRLNAGYLQRCVDHATTVHQEELRHAVAALVDRPLRRIAGVALGALTPAGVQVSWVDETGAHSRDVRFPRTARNADELGELLRRELSAGLC